jgi:methionyl-tRNA formyltransferase
MKNIIYIGTTIFSAYILLRSIKRKYNIKIIITKEDKIKGRHLAINFSQVKKIAHLYAIEIKQPKKISLNFTDTLKPKKIKLVIVAAYGKLLPENLLSIPTYKCINIHPSLLPKYKGPSPIQTAILNGELETGLTIHRMNKSFDSGPILYQKKICIKLEDNSKTIEKKLSLLGFSSLTKVLKKITPNKKKTCNNKTQTYTDNTACNTKLITKKDVIIKWDCATEIILNKIRAYQIKPIAYTTVQGKKIIIYNAIKSNINNTYKKPGTVEVTKNNKVIIYTNTGAIELKDLQVEAEKKIKIEHLLCKKFKLFYNDLILN